MRAAQHHSLFLRKEELTEQFEIIAIAMETFFHDTAVHR